MTNRLAIIAAAIVTKAAQVAEARARIGRRPVEAGAEHIDLNDGRFSAEQIRADLLPRLNDALGEGNTLEVVEK